MKSSYQHLLLTLCLVGLVVIFSGCTAKGTWIIATPTPVGLSLSRSVSEESESAKLVDVLASDDNFKTFSEIVDVASADSVTDALSSGGFTTLFAPTEAAFAKLPEGALGDLLSKRDVLQQILLYSVIQGEIATDQTATDQGTVCQQEKDEPRIECSTLLGSRVAIQMDGAKPSAIQGVRVVGAPIRADNGVIFPIDAVIYPKEVASDIPATVPEILGGIEELSIFIKILENTKRLSGLESVGPYTIFAPTNEAFAKAGYSNGEGLDLASTDQLKLRPLSSVFIVRGKREDINSIKESESITYPFYRYYRNSSTIEEVGVLPVPVTTTGTDVFVGNAHVVDADIKAFNGVIHIVDDLLTATVIAELQSDSITDFCQFDWQSSRWGPICVCYACPTGQFPTYSSCKAACP